MAFLPKVVDLHLILSKSYHVIIDGITILFSHPQLGDGFRPSLYSFHGAAVQTIVKLI